MTRVVIFEGGDQPIRYVPLDMTAKPTIVSSSAYQIDDLRYALGAAERTVVPLTAIVQDPTSTLTLADVGAGTVNRTRVPVTSAAGFVAGRKYMLQGSEHEALVQVRQVDAVGNILVVESKIVATFPAGDTIRGVELEGVFPAIEASNDDDLANGGGPYGLDWTYDGIKRRSMVYIRRHNVPFSVTREDLVEFEPALANHWDTLINPERAIRAAMRSWIGDLTAAGLSPSRYHSPLAEEAVASRAIAICWYAVLNEETGGTERGDRHMKRYSSLISNIKNGLDGQKVVETGPEDQAKGPRRRMKLRVS